MAAFAHRLVVVAGVVAVATATLLLSLVTLSVSLPEFVALQRMPYDAIRARFKLPRDCEPRLTASADPPGKILVIVGCATRALEPDRDRND